VEYSSTPFLMFFFAEYVNIMLLSAMMTILFLGGWHAPIDIGVQFIPPFFWFFLKTAFSSATKRFRERLDVPY